MKNIDKKTRILAILIIVIIIVGIIITLTVGFNFELKYKDTKRLELYIQKDYEISDIEKITGEVLQNQEVVVQKVELYEDSVSIMAKEITEEQKTEIINKINEKYGSELVAENNKIESIPHTKLLDIIKPYIGVFIISTIIILLYMGIRYKKLGIVKTVLRALAIIVLSQAILISLVAICRISIGITIIPMILIVYMAILLVTTKRFEKELSKKIQEDEEINKKEIKNED